MVECQGKKIGYVAAKQAKGVAPLIYDGSFVGGRLVSAKTLEVRLRPENVQK